MPDWWNKLSHVLVLISWGRWNCNSMRKKIWLPGHVRSRKRDDVMWHKCYLHRNWTQISKIYHWELRMVLLNRPHLLQQKTQNKVFGKVFSKQRAGWYFCSTNSAFTFDATQIDFHAQGYDCSKFWRRVNWSPDTCIFVFPFRHRQEYRKIRSKSVSIERKYLKVP